MIWLIGNSGLLGQEIESMLKREKFQYIGTGHQIDITNIDAIRKFSKNKNFNWIINCAAYTAVDNAENDSQNAFSLNHHALANLAQTAEEKNAKVIHFSTDYVFDGKKSSCYTEEDTPNPLAIYGKSKYAGEQALARWRKNFIIRISWLFGHNKNNFVKTMLNLFHIKEQIKIINDQFGLPTYTKDLAEAIKLLLQNESTKYGIYHYCNNGEKISWFDFALEIYQQAKDFGFTVKDIKMIPISTAEYKQTALRPHNSCLCTNKIIQELKISIPYWKNALKRYLLSEKKDCYNKKMG